MNMEDGLMKELTLRLYTISRFTHSYYARELKKLNLSMGQFPFLMGIATHDGISQEMLSAKLRIGKSTTATIIRQLLDAGLITREVDENDRRSFKLHATPAACELVPLINDIIDRCHNLITADLTDVERIIFASLTEKVCNRTEFALGNFRNGEE